MGGRDQAHAPHMGNSDKLAVCERPGGYARNHRKVRRREEILWLKCQGFTRVVSLLASPHNLYAYDEEELAWSHIPFAANDDPALVLPDLYGQLRSGSTKTSEFWCTRRRSTTVDGRCGGLPLLVWPGPGGSPGGGGRREALRSPGWDQSGRGSRCICGAIRN